MAKYLQYEYVSLPDLLAGGSVFEYQFLKPSKCSVRIAILKEELINRIFEDKKPLYPEVIACKLYPVFKKYLEQQLSAGAFAGWVEISAHNSAKLLLFVDENFAEIKKIYDETPPPDIREQIKLFVMISAHNIFSDNSIPSSIRLIADALGVDEGRIRSSIAGDSGVKIVNSDFVVLNSPYDM